MPAGRRSPGRSWSLSPPEGDQPDAHGDADDRGRFEVPCPTGKAIIYARSPAGDLAGYMAVDDKDDREVAIIAGPAATARGRVVDEDGKPWASGNVAYYVEIGPPGAGMVAPVAATQVVLTDDDGRFIAPGLPVGTTVLFLRRLHRAA